MKFIWAIFFLIFVTSGFQTVGQTLSDGIHFTSLNSAIYLGQYDGVETVAEVKKHGNFGLGSEEALVGEIIMLAGIMYSIPSNGMAKVIQPNTKIAFAAVKFFRADKTNTTRRSFATAKQFEMYLDSILDKNAFAAIQVTANFSYIKFRSFYPQQKPYSQLDDALAAMFERKNIDGTLVGFYTPKSADVLNSPVYHFHFLDTARATGGHVLDFQIEDVKIEIDYASSLHVTLPAIKTLEHVNLNQEVRKSN